MPLHQQQVLNLSGKTGLPITKTKDSYIVENKETKQTQTFKLLENGTPAEPIKFAKAVLGSMKLDKLGLDEDQTLKFVKEYFGNKKIGSGIVAAGAAKVIFPNEIMDLDFNRE